MNAGAVLVTGATGFLGGAVARELARQGVPVRATGRNRAMGAALIADGIPFVECDLAQEHERIPHLLEGCQSVIHAAALSSPWGARAEFVAANVAATRRLVEYGQQVGIERFVHISTPSVHFAFGEQTHLTEEQPWAEPPANDYIATKRVAESIAKEAGAVILRPRALFGPGDTTLLPRLIRVARRGVFPLFGSGDPQLDLTWIGDAVEAILLALRSSPVCEGRIYHITSGTALPLSEILASLFEACELAVRYRRIPIGRALAMAGLLETVSRVLTRGTWEPPLTRYAAGALAYERTLDISAARRDLGYAPHTDIVAALALCGREWRLTQGWI